jgi:hypothetical protein
MAPPARTLIDIFGGGLVAESSDSMHNHQETCLSV